MLLNGQVAILTGGGAGIGRAVAFRMAQEGAAVLLLDKDSAGAQATARQIEAAGGKAEAFEADVLDYERLAFLAGQAEERYGSFHIWCNCAGVSTMNHAWELTEAEWDLNMDVNAKGVFLCTKAALRHMMPRRYGRIINMASIASLQADPLLAHYCASKWAVAGFSKTVAHEVGSYGITVNCVCPATVCTDMQSREASWAARLRGVEPRDIMEEWLAGTPAGRLVTPEDVAEAVLFFASPAASMITGVTLPVTGGASL